MKNSPSIMVYGRRLALEALTLTPEVVEKVLFAPGKKDDEVRERARAHHITMGDLSKKEVSEDSSGQGVAVRVHTAKLLTPLETFLAGTNGDKNTAVAILGEVHDVQNMGAIIRSAFAFGLSAVLFPTHNQASLSEAVFRTSAGAVFRLPLIEVGNVNQAIESLKKSGFWIYGLSGDATARIDEESFTHPSAFIVGNEATGIREKTKEHCDHLLRIPINEECDSLNASVSAGIAFYEWRVRHAR